MAEPRRPQTLEHPSSADKLRVRVYGSGSAQSQEKLTPEVVGELVALPSVFSRGERMNPPDFAVQSVGADR